MNKKEFFENLAMEAGTGDISLVKHVYYGLIRKTIKSLAKKGDIIYPDFGEFKIKVQKAKKMNFVKSGEIIEIPPVKTVRFKPDYKLKNYIKET